MAIRGLARAAIAGLALGTAAIPATAQDDLASKAINRPGLAWTITGATARTLKDANVAGGRAIEVKVPSKGANPWTVSASAPIDKGVKKGDKLVLAFYGKVIEAPGDKTTLPAMIQITTDPYTPAISGSVDLSKDWQLVQINGLADGDHAPGTIAANLHLAGNVQTIALGPVYVFDLGQGG